MNTHYLISPLEKPIVLVGMMGCGKSAIGNLLAKTLHLSFADVDALIEQKKQMTISHMFEQYGEAYFREQEYQTIHALLQNKPSIIAVGGGAFIQEKTQTLIKQYAISIWIYANYEVLLERLLRKHHRPLLEHGNKEAIIKELMQKRYPVYAQAEMTVETSTGAHEIVIERIIEQLNKRHMTS
jgi:shikimate kinase